ncbi:sirohydrochlorin cobaltochelatase [Catenulispora sp. GP43]|jgi:hypothetical protein|uniref:hypothetical protein n=1 Tax=Catenulispora sp. GP43 TaxID=3156263 RepID=UPI0035139975
MNALIRQSALNDPHNVVRVTVVGTPVGTPVMPAAGTARAAVVIVGGHEGGADVEVEPSAERGALFRAASARRELGEVVREALETTDLPVCVVPMTLGRDPRLVADAARTLMSVPVGAAAGRIVLAEPFGTATLLTGWLRVAVAQAAGSPRATDLAALVIANAANRFDDAELFRIAHLVRTQGGLPWVEVALRGGDPGLAEGIARCEMLGARRIALIPADFGSATGTGPGVIDGAPLLSPAAVSGVLATRTSAALLKLSRGDDGIG